MVDWATLPNDMLVLISKSLESSFDLVKFRSVCSSWRNAAAEPKRRLLPLQDFPIIPGNGGRLFPDSALGFRLSQRIILLIKPHHEQADSIIGGWLIKVKEDFHIPRKLSLPHPLADYSRFFPRRFSRVLDMSKFKVREMGREFNLHCLDTGGYSFNSPYTQKTVVKYLDSDEESRFVLLTILVSGYLDVSGKLAVFTSWDQAWTVINEDGCFCDVILFHGCFFAVEDDGRTVVVDFSSMKLTMVASPVFGGEKKVLVESCGDLLLVDMYLGIKFDAISLWNFEEEDYMEHNGVFGNEITHKIKVFKLVEREKSWVEVKDLGDKILFLGDESTFSASASDILPLYGGSVFFHGFVFDWEDLDTMDYKDLGVCEFTSGKIKIVRQHPEYAKLFWPPPPWITSPKVSDFHSLILFF
ncbi:F-box domain [Arabidopsis thaliana x Arabidopsis arenosa]|uniref:F-box domain n=1 Tax=Arabidopsis thaliana x Arabidopsis arenosa TaxID=1240361 RepID=A0A8T2ACL3_9BRAS|nr:F-box domain [Arabidopsis thaliana x Arabidopsis arenosa]